MPILKNILGKFYVGHFSSLKIAGILQEDILN
jgi:hypothetical protein